MKYSIKTPHHQQMSDLLYLLFMRYMLNISDEEKQSLLAQHQQPYNGYQTLKMQEPDNRISVYDPAGDKKGVQVTANGNVRTYSNVNLRESKGGMCEECGSGMMREGECNECGYTIKNPEPMYSQGFDYTNEEVSASLQQPYSDIDFGSYDFDSKGPEQFETGDEDLDYSSAMQKQQDILDYASQHDGNDDVSAMLRNLEKSMDSEYDGKEKLGGEKEPYEFDSDGPLATSGVFREMEDPEDVEKVKESIKESLNWFKRFSKYN